LGRRTGAATRTEPPHLCTCRPEFRGLRVAARHGGRRDRAVPGCAEAGAHAGAVHGALSDVGGRRWLEVGVRVSDVTCCHPMSLAVYARWEVC
jgi:hypothetical protein